MWEHTKRVSQSCFYHICAFLRSRYRRSFGFRRLDYANSVLYGSPSWCLTRMKRIQNLVTWIVLQHPSLSSRDTLQQLHWLPVKWRMQFKLASLTYKVLHTGTPSYPVFVLFLLCGSVVHNLSLSVSLPCLANKRVHICLNASIRMYLLARCDHPLPLTCTYIALIFILVHARFILQLQQSGILFLPPFVRLKP